MPFDTPFAIGTVGVSEQALRAFAYAATDKAEGIVDIGDFRVHQTAVAGSTLVVDKGAALVINKQARTSSNEGQTYSVRRGDSGTVAPDPTTGAARSDMIILRVKDPLYAPWGPTDTVPEFYVVKGVPSTATKISDLNSGAGLPYSAIPLARIDIPSNTGAFTDAMITPLRKMASPRRQRALNAVNLTASEVQTVQAAGGEIWPNEAYFVQEIPAWATRARVVATWGQVIVPAGNGTGWIWARIGEPSPGLGVDTRHVGYNGPGSTQPSRSTFACADDVAIPAAMRGLTTHVHLRGQWNGVGSTSARVSVDSNSSVSLDIEFLEAPAEDA